jgi:putative ABC transport system ATP-binding protein
VLLGIENLHFKYNDSNRFSYPDFQIQAGNDLLILGQSGHGKTTLLHLLAGFITPEKGNVNLMGIDYASLSSSKLDSIRGENIGIVFQEPHFLRSLTAIQNVQLACKSAGLKADVTYLSSLFNQLGIELKINEPVNNLSVGEQQRVNIIRALANKPKLILADEPTSALDDLNCERVVKELKMAAAVNNSGLIIVSHDNRLINQFNNSIQL